VLVCSLEAVSDVEVEFTHCSTQLSCWFLLCLSVVWRRCLTWRLNSRTAQLNSTIGFCCACL